MTGLILAGASAYFARRASVSAEQARKAVLSSTLAEEISIAAKLAGEITELIEFGKHEIARLRCGDLHDKTVMILKRWDADLSEESKNNCLNAKAQLEVLRVGVLKFAAGAAEPTPRQLLQMQSACMKIKEIFVVEHASAMRRDDEARNA